MTGIEVSTSTFLQLVIELESGSGISAQGNAIIKTWEKSTITVFGPVNLYASSCRPSDLVA